MGNTEVKLAELEVVKTKLEHEAEIQREKTKLEEENKRRARELEQEKLKLEEETKRLTNELNIHQKVELANLEMTDKQLKDAYRHEAQTMKENRGKLIQKFQMGIINKMVDKGVDPIDLNIYLAAINRALYNSKSSQDNKYLEDSIRHKISLATHSLPSASSSSTPNTGLGREDDERRNFNYGLDTDDEDESNSEPEATQLS